jgi:hypothetical protein
VSDWVIAALMGLEGSYRGHASTEWPLLPKAGRVPFSTLDDRAYLEAWKRRAVPFVTGSPSAWDWLAIAQHHGLPTRLLDWTGNPLVAAFFAVESGPMDADGAIYAYRSEFHSEFDKTPDPMKIPGITMIRTKAVAPRLINQDGRFTLHSPTTEALVVASSNLHRIVIDKRYKPTLRTQLAHYGINHASMFPDLDGLSRHLSWVWETASKARPHGETEPIF